MSKQWGYGVTELEHSEMHCPWSHWVQGYWHSKPIKHPYFDKHDLSNLRSEFLGIHTHSRRYSWV